MLELIWSALPEAGELSFMAPTAAESAALHETAGLVDFSQRSLIELRGDDRTKFLHSFCTNDIRRLEAGSGCEAFVLNAQERSSGMCWCFAIPTH